jgi:hypothetical protein
MKIQPCRDCPINPVTEDAMMAVNYGCLPMLCEALEWFNNTGRVWACHKYEAIPCGGVLKHLIEIGATIDFSKPFITTATTSEELKPIEFNQYENTTKL